MTAWSDREIEPGSKWFSDIQAALARASVAVLLVTPDFLASDFIREHELDPILKEVERGRTRLVWIPIRASAFRQTRLKEYQAVIPPDKPLASMEESDQDEAWVTICEAIETAAKQD